MAASDLLFTSVAKTDLSNSQTAGVDPGDQTKVSDFLTVQSLANFAAMTGALTVTWKALQSINAMFSAPWVPAVMAFLWFLVSFVVSAAQQEAKARRSPRFWLPAAFIGLVNSSVLYAAVIGIR